MQNNFSNNKHYLARLKSVEQNISKIQLQEAASQLNLLAKTNPGDPRLFILGARLAERANNPQGTLVAARRAHELAPQWPVASFFLATVLADQGQASEALAMTVLAVEQTAPQPAAASVKADTLIHAADLAQRLGQYQQALTWLRQADALRPQDTSTQYKIGLSLSATGDFATAIDVLTALLVIRPNDPAILSARRQAALAAQDIGLAVQDAQALLSIDPANQEHSFYLAIAQGETPPTQPASVIAHLFNALAPHYDQIWSPAFGYTLAHDVAHLISSWYPARDADVLDLGCGTGQLGAAMGRNEGVIVGVDLSQAMIEQAAQRKVYDKFHHVNLLDALQATPEGLYHIISALDVFNYVGNLDVAIPNALRILVPGGRLVFSCETGADDGTNYSLNNTHRYSHQRSYVQALLKKSGFKDIKFHDRVLRQESDKPIHGFLVTAVKAPVAAKKPTRKNTPSIT